MKLKKGIVKSVVNNDYVFSVIAKFIGVFMGLILSVMTARYFNPELKGISAVIENDVSLYAVFLGLGMYQAYPFFKKNCKDIDVFPTFVNHFFTLFFIYQIIAFVIAGIMFYLNINKLLAIAILLMPSEVYIKQLNYIVLIEHPRRRNMSSIFISLSEILVVVFLMIFTNASVYTSIAFVCIAKIINLMLSFINLRVNPFNLRFEIKNILQYAKFGFIPMLVFLCMTINYKIDIQMLKWFDNVSYADIGIYSIGVTLAGKIWLIPDAMKDILLSKLVSGRKEDEVAKVLRINLFISLISIVALVLLGKPVIIILFGKNYADSYYVMLLMLIGVIGMIFYKMVYSYNISRGKRVINLVFLGLAAIVNIIGNFIAIPIFGMWGAAIVSIVSYNICGMAFLIYFKRESSIPYRKLIFLQKSDLKQLKSIIKK